MDMLKTIWWCPREKFIYLSERRANNDDVEVHSCVEREDYLCIRSVVESEGLDNLTDVKNFVRDYYYQDFLQGERDEYFDNQRKEQRIKELFKEKKGGQVV